MQTLSAAAKKMLEQSAKEVSERHEKIFRLGVSWLVYKIRAESKCEMTIESGKESGPIVFKVSGDWLDSVLK